MNKILRVEESSQTELPKHLKKLIDHMSKQRAADGPEGFLPYESDLVYAVALVVALEEGFRLDETCKTHGFDKRAFESLGKLPTYKTDDMTYSLELKLPKVVEMKFNLVASTVPEESTLILMLATGVDKDFNDCASIVIEQLKYVIVDEAENVQFQKMAELCHAVKHPLGRIRIRALRSLGLACPDIVGIPRDVKVAIFKMLRPSDFLSLCRSTAAMYRYANDEEIWRHFLKRDFNELNPQHNEDYYATYKSKAGTKPSTSTAFRRIEDRFVAHSDFSFDLPPYPEQYM